MKLKHIHIDAYRFFQDFDIGFCYADKIQNLTVITGVNGNGKTTLLRDVIFGDDSAVKPKGCMVIENEGKLETFVLPEVPSSESYYKAFSKVVFYKAEDKSSVLQLQKEILKFVDKYVYVQGKTSFEAYRIIQSLIEDIFVGFDLQVRFKGINENKQLVFTNLNGEEFGIDGLSSGEQQILSKIFPLFTDDMKGHVVLIDEPEDSLHPSWQTRLIPVLRRCAESNDCQFILATHSPQIISSAHKEEIRIFTRDDKGNIRVGSCLEGSYGWTVEKVLSEIQGVEFLRVPEVERQLAELREMIQKEEYDTKEFQVKLLKLETLLGYSDRDLVLIRMEVIRKRKQA